MTTTALTLNVRPAGHDVYIADIQGEINAQAENALMDAYNSANSQGACALILNFAGLEYMNSSGIGLLVTLLIRVRRQGQRLLAYGLNEHYRHILSLTRLDEAIRVCDTESQAVAAAAQAG